MPGTYDAGSVSRRQARIDVIDVTVTPEHREAWDADGADEYIIKVNGHVVKRMSRYQARAWGIIMESES